MIRFSIRTICLVFAAYVQLVESTDPCDAASNTEVLPSLTERIVGYELAAGENAVCDKYLPQDRWYKLPGHTISNTTDSCGTTYVWFIQGPTDFDDNVDHDITLCMADYACTYSLSGRVKRCSDDNYVYNLPQTLLCASAYCIRPLDNSSETQEGPPPDISSINPHIVTEIERYDILSGGHVHYCDITPVADSTLWYTVTWSLSDGSSNIGGVYVAPMTQYGNQTVFRMQTALKEATLVAKGILKLGYSIKCKVTARRTVTSSAASDAIESSDKFCGIQVLSRTVNIHVTEKIETAKIKIRLTVPFACPVGSPACTLDLTMYIPKVADCRISSVAYLDHQKLENKPCGISLTNEHVNNDTVFEVQSILGTGTSAKLYQTFNVLLAVAFSLSHHMASGYFLDPIKILTYVNQGLINGKWCYAHSDPHMRSFDGRDFHPQILGVFLMYRNKRKNVEVQIKTAHCFGGTGYGAHCVTGVGIRAGQDVYVANLDGSDIGFKQCGDHILDEKIVRNGKSFKAYLPTGTVVHFFKSWRFFEVDIYPSIEDFDNTDGLCGTFDGNSGNDQTDFPYPCTDPVKCLRVMDDDNLFSAYETAIKTFPVWSEEVSLCTCPNDASTGGQLDATFSCSQYSQTTLLKCQSEAVQNKGLQYCKEVRSKRDVHTSTETNFDLIHPQKESRAKRSIPLFNETTAREECSRLMNTTVIQMCSNLPLLDISFALADCVLDVLASDSLDWVQVHIDAIKTVCIQHVQFNQPIPPEVLSQFNVSTFNTTDNITTTTTASPFSDTGFTPELLQELKDAYCPNDCSGNGECIGGQCVCKDEFIDDDCSINKMDPPEMVGIPDKGICDITQRECAQTSVLGRQFVETEQMICKYTPFEVDINNEITIGTTETSIATIESFVEVVCPLPTVTKKRSSNNYPGDNYVGRGYKVAVSNTGENFSPEDTLVIFDSTCVNCSKQGGTIICTANDGYCLQNGRCYRPGDMYGCYICDNGTLAGAQWAEGIDCQEQTTKPTPGEKSKTLIIIVAVICVSVILLVVLILVIVRLCWKKKPTIHVSYQAEPEYDVPVKDINGKTSWGIFNGIHN